jgi:hypothetical protein
MRTLRTGCSFWLTSTTCMPLASVRISYGGKAAGRAGSGGGGYPAAMTTVLKSGLRRQRRSLPRYPAG